MPGQASMLSLFIGGGSRLTPKTRTISVRVTADLKERAQKQLARQGLTLSAFIRQSLIVAANNEVASYDFYDSPTALAAKAEAEAGETETIGSLQDLGDWLASLDDAHD